MKLAFTLLALSLASCSRKTETAMDIRMVEGLETRMNTDTPAEGIFVAVLTPEMTLGEKEILSQPTQLLVDNANNLYVLDWREATIKSYSPSGRYLRTLCIQGQGPTEIGIPASMAWDPQGHVVILDGRNQRFTVVDTLGRYVTTKRIEGYRDDLLIDPLGRFWWAEPKQPKNAVRSTDFTLSIRNLYLHYSQGLNGEAGTIGPFMGDRMFIKYTDTGSMSRGSRHWPTTAWTVDDQGHLITAYTETYKLTVYDREGQPGFAFGRSFTPVANPYRERDGQTPNLPAFYERMVLDEAQRLWLRLYGDELENEEAKIRYDVFSPEGRYLMQVVTDHAFFAFHGGKVYSITRNSDEPIVCRYDLHLEKQ